MVEKHSFVTFAITVNCLVFCLSSYVDSYNTGVQEWRVDMATGARPLRLHVSIWSLLPGPYPAVYQQRQGC